MEIDSPRALRVAEAVASRRALLHEPHVAPLTTFVEKLRARDPKREFPDFDPLDGGVNADILFLFEKPGRMTSTREGGSGFISRDNDDPTAEATFHFMNQAKLSRDRTATWNIVPGWNGTRKIINEEFPAGLDAVRDFFSIMKKLRALSFRVSGLSDRYILYR